MPIDHRYKNFFSNFGFLLLILGTIIATLIVAPITPLETQRFFYTITVNIRNLLTLTLPLLVFPYIVCSFNDLRKSGTLLMVAIIALIMISNFSAILLAYPLGTTFIPCLGIKGKLAISPNSDLTSFFQLDLSSPFSIETIVIIGIISGIFLALKPIPLLEKFFHQYQRFSTFCFEKIIIPALPIYIVGTLFKVSYDMDFSKIFGIFGRMLGLIFVTQIVYISFLFLIGNKGNIRKALTSFRNALPAGFLGLSTMSSVITMPVTLKAAEKNTKNPLLSQVWVTTSVNCHAIGDALSLPLIALTLVYCWGMPFPTFEQYFSFAFYVALAQFTAVSIPEGSLIAILPFLQSTFGFDTEMIGIITVLSVFCDPLGTSQNVMGNSAMVIIAKRFFGRLISNKSPAQ